MGSDSAETARLVKAVGEDVVSFATQGGLLTKFPFGEGAAPKVRFFQASDDGMYLLWGDAKQAGPGRAGPGRAGPNRAKEGRAGTGQV